MKKQYFYIFLFFTFLFSKKTQAQVDCDGMALYEETDGLLVIEMETGILSEQWQEGNTEPNFTGDGYIYWSGTQFFNQTGNGPIEYPIRINTAGTYKFTWRMAVGLGNQVSEHNDTWLKIDADDFYGEKVGTGHIVKPQPECQSDPLADCPMGSSANGFLKVWGQSTSFIWASFTSDNDAHLIYATFDEPGDYTITINARSSWCLLDRMVLQLVPDVTDNTAQALSTPASDCTDGTSNTSELGKLNQLKLSPNPVEQQLLIEVANFDDASYQIFHTNGQVMRQGLLTGNRTAIDVAQFQQGVYIFQVTQDDKTQAKRFVKL